MVMEALVSIKTAWDVAKIVKTVSDDLGSAELKMQVAELMSALADAKVQAAETVELVAELEKIIKTKSEMSFDGNMYYKKKDGGDKEGPWCPTCYDVKSLEVRLHSGNYQGIIVWDCRNCKQEFS